MTKLFSTLPVFASVSLFRATAGQSAERMAVLTVHGNEVPHLFKGATGDDAKETAADYFFKNFSTEEVKQCDFYIMPYDEYVKWQLDHKMSAVVKKTAMGVDDKRALPRKWVCKEGQTPKRVLESEVDQFLADGWMLGKVYGYTAPVPKGADEPHGNTEKVWMHKVGDDGVVERVRVSAYEVTPHASEGYKIGQGPKNPRTPKVTEPEVQTAA